MNIIIDNKPKLNPKENTTLSRGSFLEKYLLYIINPNIIWNKSAKKVDIIMP